MAIVQNSATLFSAHQNEPIAIATATFGNAGGRRCLVMTSPQKQDLVMQSAKYGIDCATQIRPGRAMHQAVSCAVLTPWLAQVCNPQPFGTLLNHSKHGAKPCNEEVF